MSISEPTPAASDPRVEFAAERTLLAWIRTSLALMGFGFVVARFGLFLREIAAARDLPPPPPTGVSFWVGTTLILLGVTVLFVAAAQHVGVIRRLRTDPPRSIRCSGLGIGLTLILALIGAALAVYLIATTGASP